MCESVNEFQLYLNISSLLENHGFKYLRIWEGQRAKRWEGKGEQWKSEASWAQKELPSNPREETRQPISIIDIIYIDFIFSFWLFTNLYFSIFFRSIFLCFFMLSFFEVRTGQGLFHAKMYIYWGQRGNRVIWGGVSAILHPYVTQDSKTCGFLSWFSWRLPRLWFYCFWTASEWHCHACPLKNSLALPEVRHDSQFHYTWAPSVLLMTVDPRDAVWQDRGCKVSHMLTEVTLTNWGYWNIIILKYNWNISERHCNTLPAPYPENPALIIEISYWSQDTTQQTHCTFNRTSQDFLWCSSLKQGTMQVDSLANAFIS